MRLRPLHRQSVANAPMVAPAPSPQSSTIRSLGVHLFRIALAIALWTGGAETVQAQTPDKPVPMRKASQLISKQNPPQVVPRVYEKLTPATSRVLVSLSKQRAYLMLGEETAIDTPVSTGKTAGMTSPGKFSVLEKDPDHHSNIFGDFVDARGRVVRAGVSMKIDSAPSGTHYIGAPMKWFMRLSDGGIGMHVGLLPGYPASHGCVRLPVEIAPLIYEKVQIGTPVEIVP